MKKQEDYQKLSKKNSIYDLNENNFEKQNPKLIGP